MALTPRHRWCAAKVVEAFQPEVSEAQVQSFIRDDENLSLFTRLFSESAPSVLFVHYQPRSAGVQEDWTSEAEEPSLFVSDGVSSFMCAKTCYFLHNSP
eukprot:scaffold6256_cov181-Pinguiococcus_pyrenoidosus.AAC.1